MRTAQPPAHLATPKRVVRVNRAEAGSCAVMYVLAPRCSLARCLCPRACVVDRVEGLALRCHGPGDVQQLPGRGTAGALDDLPAARNRL